MNTQELLLSEKQAYQAEIEKLRQENTFFKNEVESLTLDIAQLEGNLLDAQVKVNQRSQTFKCIQLMYQEIASAKEVGHIYSITVKYLFEKVGFDKAIIFKKQKESFVPVASCGYTDSQSLQAANKAFLNQIAQQNQGILINSKTKDSYPELLELRFKLTILSLYRLPFKMKKIISCLLVIKQKVP